MFTAHATCVHKNKANAAYKTNAHTRTVARRRNISEHKHLTEPVALWLTGPTPAQTPVDPASAHDMCIIPVASESVGHQQQQGTAPGAIVSEMRVAKRRAHVGGKGRSGLLTRLGATGG